MASFQLIVASMGNAFMRDIADLYAAALSDLGHEVRVDMDVLPEVGGPYSIIVAPQEYRPLFLVPFLAKREIEMAAEAKAGATDASNRGSSGRAGVLMTDDRMAELEQVVWSNAHVLCVDQPGSHFFSIVERVAKWSLGVLDISPMAVEHWKKSGLPVVHFPLPFRKFAEEEGPATHERPVDLLFLGTDSPRRIEFFSKHAGFIDGIDARVRFLRHMEPIHENENGAVFGKERSRHLHESKVFLNIHATRRPYFEWHRAMLAIAHGCLLVTESSRGHEPLVEGRDFLSGGLDELPELCAKLLQDPAMAEEMRRSARSTLLKDFDHVAMWDEITVTLDSLSREMDAWRKRQSPVREKIRRAPASRAEGNRNGKGKDKTPGGLPRRIREFLFGDNAPAIKLGRRFGLERDGKNVVIRSQPAAFVIKPVDNRWPDTFARVIVDFGSPLPDGAIYVETEEFMAGEQLTLRHAVTEKQGRISFGIHLRPDLVKCSLVMELPIGSKLPCPKAWCTSLDRQESLALVSRTSDAWLARIQTGLRRIEHGGDGKTSAPHGAKLEEMEFKRIANLFESGLLRQKLSLNQMFEHQAQLMGMATFSIDRNFEPAGAPPPAISVVIPLYNYAGYVADAIASVIAAMPANTPGGTEIIVVDDCSSDAGSAVVREIMAGMHTPVTLLQRVYNRGLAEARNLGMNHARGEFVFFLDADNLLLPGGLRRLREALVTSNAPAAYGMLAVFYEKKDDAGMPRDSLLSQFPWDEKWLLRGNYIDAMAMFRRSVLMSLGGYDPSLALRAVPGWEDYEMWLRFLSRGLAPIFVPTVIGKYRKHGNSMMDQFFLHSELLLPVMRQRYKDLYARHASMAG